MAEPSVSLTKSWPYILLLLKLAWKILNLSNASSQINNLIKLTFYEKGGMGLLTHLQSELKATSSWPSVGPDKEKHQAPAQRRKFKARILLSLMPVPTAVQLKRKRKLYTANGFITRHADCCIISMFYPTFNNVWLSLRTDQHANYITPY